MTNAIKRAFGPIAHTKEPVGEKPVETQQYQLPGARGAPPTDAKPKSSRRLTGDDLIHDQETAKEIGARLRVLRKDYLEISSQENFAEPLGVTRGAVANWEIGKGISRVNLYRIAQAYDVSMVWLSTGKGTPQGGGSTAEDLPALIEDSGLPQKEQDEFVEDVKALLDTRIKRHHADRGNGGPDATST